MSPWSSSWLTGLADGLAPKSGATPTNGDSPHLIWVPRFPSSTGTQRMRLGTVTAASDAFDSLLATSAERVCGGARRRLLAGLADGLGDEVGHVLGIAADVQPRRHLAVPARATVLQRVEHQRLV